MIPFKKLVMLDNFTKGRCLRDKYWHLSWKTNTI